MNSDYLIIWLIVWIVCALIGGVIGDTKGRVAAGVALGFVLGLLGVLIIALMPPTQEKTQSRQRTGSSGAVGAFAGPSSTATRFAATSGASPTDLRRRAVREALERDPTLAADDPQTLARLKVAADEIEGELQLRQDRDAILDNVRRERDAALPRVYPSSDESSAERVDILSENEKRALRQVPPESTEAGWYHDPLGRSSARYWNGQQWTGRLLR
jgi:hypothetical protein